MRIWWMRAKGETHAHVPGGAGADCGAGGLWGRGGDAKERLDGRARDSRFTRPGNHGGDARGCDARADNDTASDGDRKPQSDANAAANTDDRADSRERTATDAHSGSPADTEPNTNAHICTARTACRAIDSAWRHRWCVLFTGWRAWGNEHWQADDLHHDGERQPQPMAGAIMREDVQPRNHGKVTE